jgi:predicted  nucleic acid-binding Zn-ribbon protein
MAETEFEVARLRAELTDTMARLSAAESASARAVEDAKQARGIANEEGEWRRRAEDLQQQLIVREAELKAAQTALESERTRSSTLAAMHHQ